MMKFFRNIRKTLLMENKTSKYLKYAIGEIILVVIGILIALQINNWNESKNDLIYQNKILNEILTSLKRDSLFTENIKTRVLIRDAAIANLLSFLKSGAVETDSYFIENLKEANTGIKISFDNGAYEALKSKGLEYIRNETLRSQIVNIYEVHLPRNEIFGDEMRGGYIIEKIEKELEILYDLNIESHNNVNTMIESVTLNSIEKINALKRYIHVQINISEFYNEHLDRQTRYINSLLVPLRQELDKL